MLGLHRDFSCSCNVEHFNMSRSFLAKAGKTTLELLSVSTMKMTNQKKLFCNRFRGALVTIKQPGTNAEPIGGQFSGKTSILFYSTYNVAGARCQCNLFRDPLLV